MYKKYRTVAGDTWDLIAYKTLGKEIYMDKIIKENLQYKDCYVLQAGIILNIPACNEYDEKSDILPPWKLE